MLHKTLLRESGWSNPLGVSSNVIVCDFMLEMFSFPTGCMYLGEVREQYWGSDLPLTEHLLVGARTISIMPHIYAAAHALTSI